MRDGWIETTLGDICKDGLFADGDWVESKDQDPHGDYRLLQLADIGDGAFLDKSDRWMNKEQFQRLGCTKLEVNDVLIARMPDPIGRACLLPEGLPSSATVVDVAIVRTGNEILQRMLSLIVNSPDFRNEAFSLLTGTTRQRISRGNLSKISFWLPPLTEQKRIVDLTSSVDFYVEALQQQLESAKRSRNAVLHELLTAGGDDWVETTLGKASDVIMGRQLSPSKKLGTRPRPYIRAANIGSWGINVEDIYEMDFTEIEEERFACKVGDTILVEGGNEKSVGCPAFITDKEAGLCIQNTVIRCRSTNSKLLDPHFQYHLLRFMFWRGDFAQLCAGTTIMHLGQKRAEVVPISIPPLGKQLDIVDTISKFDLTVTNLEGTLNNTKSLRSGLLSDLLSGEHEIPAAYDKVIGAA